MRAPVPEKAARDVTIPPPPPGAIDCHVHLVGQVSRYRQLPTRRYTAAPASLPELQRAAGPAVRRFVIVQPSFYGTDNTVMLAGVDALGPLARGVAVIDAVRTAGAALREMHARGVRGLRINLYSRLGGDVRRMATEFADQERVARVMGWHLQLVVPFATLLEATPMIARASVPLVIDHYGLPIGLAPDSAEGRALLDLLARPHVWVKLSAPYRVAVDDPLATTPPRDWLAAILSVAAERAVWGSDWPHTPPHEAQHGPETMPAYRPIAYARLLGDFLDALAKAAGEGAAPALARRILVGNAERLYEFPRAA